MILTFELVADLFFLVLALAYGAGALSIPEAMFGDPWAPRIYPLIISGAMSILSLVLIIAELKHQRSGKKAEPVRLRLGPDGKIIAIIVVLSLCYALLFDLLGFVIATFLFLEATMLYISKAKKMLWPTVIALLFAVGVYFVFGRMLGVTLPPGRIFDVIGG